MPLPYALGLYSVRDLYKQDFDACLAKVAEMGYTGVECFGEPTLPPEQVKAALEKNNLQLVGWHLPIHALEGDALPGTITYLKSVCCARAIVPFESPDTFKSRAAILAFAERMNAIRARLIQADIDLGYHNHEAEFIALEDGSLPWAVLMDNTRLIAQLDTGNALASGTPGLSVSQLVGRWPDRAVTVHAKPYSRKHGFATMIGEDDIDWASFLHACEQSGSTQWVIVEYEEEKHLPQLEGAEQCLRALAAIK